MSTKHKSLPKGLLLILALLVAFGVIYTLIYGATLAPTARVIVIFLVSLFGAILLTEGSVSVFEAKLNNIFFRTVGPLAGCIGLFFAISYLVPQQDTQVVRVYLEHQKRPLNKSFKCNIRVPGMEMVNKSGEQGETSVELPSTITKIDAIIIDCVGYQLRDVGPFQIVDRVIRLTMVEGNKPPPLSPEELPPVSMLADLPAKEKVLESKPAVADPNTITLSYKNVSDHNLRLLMFDCFLYYKRLEGGKPANLPWLDIPFDAKDEFTVYNSFRLGTGWYCFAVQDPKGKLHYLGCKQLFDKKNTNLTVRGTAEKFAADFD